MAGDAPFSLGFVPPAGWVKADIAPPSLGERSEVSVDAWSAWQAPDGARGHAVAGCLGLDLSSWTDEAAPVAFERLDATAAGVVNRLDATLGFTVRAERRVGPLLEHEIVSGTGEDARAIGRTILGFVSKEGHPRLRGCFVACAPTTAACEAAVANSAGSGFVEPPPRTYLLAAAATGIHHPRVVALSFVTLFFVLGAVAVWTRPRPRRK